MAEVQQGIAVDAVPGSVVVHADKDLQELKDLQEYKAHHPEDAHDPSPLEVYCDLNPEAAECRIYDD